MALGKSLTVLLPNTSARKNKNEILLSNFVVVVVFNV